MDTTSSKILCLVNPLVIRNTLLVPTKFINNSKEYNEESKVQYFRESTVEKKQYFFKICFKPDVQLYNQPFPVDANLFNEETQCVITPMSQFVGLDTYKYVTESRMSLLFTLSTCQVESEESSQSVQSPCLKFDEFLAKNIHSQLMNFHMTIHFIFQSYLIKMSLFFNEENNSQRQCTLLRLETTFSII